MTKSKTPQRIIVGMSGGVDSSVAAYLLKKAGHEVEGIYMKNWEETDENGFCPSTQDIADAQAVCDLLKIKLSVVNFANEYWERVFTYFLTEYQAGRTPNPDILCNKEIKFRAFLDYAKQQGADFIATGHYARKLIIDDGIFLAKGLDPNKDQSYFLSGLTQAQLEYSLFPIGDLNKTKVRSIAEQLGLVTHNKKDSTGICFIGERKFKKFLNDYVPAKPGNIKTLDGEIIGQHDGLMFHTIGQRQGLNIGGKKNKMQAAWYVAKKNLAHNELIVVQGADHPALFQDSLTTSNLHFINTPLTLPTTTFAKTRYRQADQQCTINQAPLNSQNTFEVKFTQPQRAITPGQFIVFYRDDICLGNGMIEY